MAYSDQYAVFSNDKRGFFSQVKTVDEARKRAHEKSYQFIANHRMLIEQEFSQMFASLQNQGTDRQEFWLYCHYCAIMLQNYYAAYSKRKEEEKYRKLSEQIKFRIEHDKFEEEIRNEDSFLKSLKKSIAADLAELASTPKHIAKIRDWVAFSNMYRIHFLFCRLTIKQSILLAQELHWLDKLGELIGQNINTDAMVAIIDAPTGVFNVLSVGLFAARFIINAGMLLKHTFAPTEAERSLSMKERFYKELSARHWYMLNDLAWGTVNLLSNFSAVFNISAPVANWLTAGFLMFDVAMLFYRQHLAEQEYLVKKAQYTAEKKNYEALMRGASISLEDMKKYQAHCNMLDEQLEKLEVERQNGRSTLVCSVAGAILLASGFSASLILATPVATLVCYFICTVGVAMYLSAGAYGKYKENELVLQQQELAGKDTTMARLAMQEARNDFMIAMVKNIVMPLLIVTTFAVCWAAALVLTAAYIGYECLNGYFKTQPKSPVKETTAQKLISESDNDEEVTADESGGLKINYMGAS